MRYKAAVSETQKKRSFERRIFVLHGFLLCCCAIIVARLIDLQIIQGTTFHQIALAQQYGGVVLPAKRGEILSRSSKTGETSILATNTTLDLLYVDPLTLCNERACVSTAEYASIADALAGLLVTPEFDKFCRAGSPSCPNELISLYKDAFDPMKKSMATLSGATLNTLGFSGGVLVTDQTFIPDITEIRRRFARDVEERIRQTRVSFVPLLYSANKQQVLQVAQLNIAGVYVNASDSLIYVNPELTNQNDISSIARQLSPILLQDPAVLKSRMIRRPLRYVPIMGRLPPQLSMKIKELKSSSKQETDARIAKLPRDQRSKAGQTIIDPFRAVALIPEHWRFYPDTQIASHVTGFINALQEPQYGIERTYDSILKGQEGLIASVSDPFGGQIVSSDQKFIDPRDGSTIVLTIDRFVQNKVENLLAAMVSKVDAESGQAIIMDPYTGRIIALANAPLFDNNSYASVYDKEAVYIDPAKEPGIVAEVFDPSTNTRILKAYRDDITPLGRQKLSAEIQNSLAELERLYDLNKVTRYYYYLGDNNRREVFPTDRPHVWLKYKNNIGVGSYVNRAVQEIYEPGSVMKPIAMAIAIDQGEVVPSDIYDDTGTVKVDVFTIKNALNAYYGKVTMVQCLDFSINTCMTSIGKKLGRKLFHSALSRFGFGSVTGIELDNELPGVLKSWREWNDALVLTAAYGQGISVTPIQMVTAFSALANGGKLMKPTIIDEIRHADSTVDKKTPTIVGQVIKPETVATVTAMLVSGTQNGFAKAGKVKGHRIAGKTGTSQIAGPGGKYETGTGSTIATYAGYAPIDHPKFVILIKLDRPKKDDFGSKSAAPLFKDIASFLFEYYGIPPDEK